MFDRTRLGQEYDDNKTNYLTTMNGKQKNEFSLLPSLPTRLQNSYMTNSHRRAHTQSFCHTESREPTEINGDAPGYQPHRAHTIIGPRADPRAVSTYPLGFPA